MGSTLRKSGLTALFTAAAFSLFSAYATPVMAQANPTDLVETFGDQVEQGDAVQQLVDMLNDGGFQLAGYCVPKIDGRIVVAGGHCLCIGRKLDAIDRTGVPF